MGFLSFFSNAFPIFVPFKKALKKDMNHIDNILLYVSIKKALTKNRNLFKKA